MKNSISIISKWIIIVIGIALMTIIFMYYFVLSPIQHHSFFPSCSFKEATGYDCIGCGGQRAMHELLHYNIISALDYNALFVMSIPLICYYVYYSLRRFIYGIPSPINFLYSPSFGISIIITVLLFFILRNVPIPSLEWLNSSVPF